jgi:hypothetical protein
MKPEQDGYGQEIMDHHHDISPWHNPPACDIMARLIKALQ